VEQALHLYRSLYRPSERHPQPQATICVWALAAETDEEARHWALSRDRWRLDRGRGRLGPLRHPDTIAQQGFSPQELQTLDPMRQSACVGSAATVAAKLRTLADTLQLDELVVNTWAADPQVRRRSYALIHQALG
jgi:alkanesulfonate monooxygenase SsuD/methylene tetrahydromethanopterin reductase-like flavin-dependent oxidoreductase (luciferase family)